MVNYKALRKTATILSKHSLYGTHLISGTITWNWDKNGQNTFVRLLQSNLKEALEDKTMPQSKSHEWIA